jgi:hypothetical protein
MKEFTKEEAGDLLKEWLIINGLIVDLKEYKHSHPGIQTNF